MNKLQKFKLNIPLSICLILFMIISVITINSAMLYLPSYLGNLAFKQIIWYLLGFSFIFFIIKISNQFIFKYAWYIYIITIILLAILLIIGEPINGSRCWFILPGIGSFQPSEFMKISLIFVTSLIVENYIENNKICTLKNEIGLLFKILGIFILPSILTFLEPDTGSVFIYFIICISILWVSPLRKRWFLFGISILLLLISIFFSIYFFKQDLFVEIFGTDLFYRIDRLLDWKNGTGMQLENSLTSIGSSNWFGHGYKNTPIYFPESGTDFIFAVFASNFGLIGSIFLLILILFFDIYLVKLAKRSKKVIDKCTLIGIIGMLLYQQFQNIGMTLGILPITGITLPFISYGGSSLLSYLIIIGIILNIYHDNHKTIN